MKIDLITLFPVMICWASQRDACSNMLRRRLFSMSMFIIYLIDLEVLHNTMDDRSFEDGAGMLLKLETLF